MSRGGAGASSIIGQGIGFTSQEMSVGPHHQVDQVLEVQVFVGLVPVQATHLQASHFGFDIEQAQVLVDSHSSQTPIIPSPQLVAQV
jgi:hypothetical protein